MNATFAPDLRDPRVLSDLGDALKARARAIEDSSPEMVARRELTPEGIEKLATIYCAGGKETAGFWRRYRVLATCAEATNSDQEKSS
jgi:hypothetical protein